MCDYIKKRKILCCFLSLLLGFVFNMNLAFGTEPDSTTQNTQTSTSTPTTDSTSPNSGTGTATPENKTGTETSQTFKSTSSSGTVSIEIVADKDSYTLDDTATFTIKLVNDGDTSVFIKDLKFGFPEYIEKQIKSKLPEKIEANAPLPPTEVPVKMGFVQWQNVTLNKEQLKVGIKATTETIPEDSNFVVEMISSSSESDSEYQKLLANFDEKDNIERICFFDFSLTGPDKKEKRNLNGYAKIYIQIPKDWDDGELETMFVQDKEDENFEETVEELDGVKYLTFSTNHFSPYAMFDPEKITAEDLETLSKEFMQTGHSDLKTILVLVGVAIVSLVLALVFSNKFRRSLFGVMIFLSFCNICALVHAETTPNTSSKALSIKLEIIDSKGSNISERQILPSFTAKTYADNDLWAKKDTITEDDKKAGKDILNVFFVGPSIFDETYENSVQVGNMSIFDTRAQTGLKNQIEHFEQTLNSALVKKNMSDGNTIKYYAPNYRTVTIPTYKDNTQLAEYIKEAYSDIKDAFDASLLNTERPSAGNVLIGFGTGAILCDMLATEYDDEQIISGCICLGLGREITRTSCITFNLACIDSDVSNIPSKPAILDADLLSSSQGFTEYEAENMTEDGLNFNGKLFDLTTGKVLPGSENGYIDNIVTPKESLDETQPGWQDGATMIFKVTPSTNTDLNNMISKTKEYIGEGIYHLFDYQFLYNAVINLLTLD